MTLALRSIAGAAVLVGCLAFSNAGVAGASVIVVQPPPGTPSSATPIESYLAGELLADVQAERAARGLAPLDPNQSIAVGQQQIMNAEAAGTLPAGLDNPTATLQYQSVHGVWIESGGDTTGNLVNYLMNQAGSRSSLLLPGADDQVGIGVGCTPSGNAFVMINEDNLAPGVNQVPTPADPIVTTPSNGSTCSTVPSTTVEGSTGWTATGSLQGQAVGMAASPDGEGYWLASATGSVSAHGDAVNFGSLATLGIVPSKPIAHIVSTPDGKGYWLVAADGGVFSFGDAHFYGSMGGRALDAPVVDLAPTANGGGYWLVAADGGIFAFGNATFHGSMGGQHLNQPVVGIAPDHVTGGYWEVATDGGIFAFDAPFHGSTGSIHLTEPVNGMAATPDANGYWFVAYDGGVFAFGNARFQGSMGASQLVAPIVGMATDDPTNGYWLLGEDGGIFSFDAPFLGAG